MNGLTNISFWQSPVSILCLAGFLFAISDVSVQIAKEIAASTWFGRLRTAITGRSKIESTILRMNNRPSWEWMKDWTNKWRRGVAHPATMFVFWPAMALMVFGSFAIPIEHASVINQTSTTGQLYLPHVSDEMDDYHWWAVDGDQHRMLLTFCADKGFHPPFAEGQTITWMRYRSWPKCIELVAADCLRDSQHNCIRREHD